MSHKAFDFKAQKTDLSAKVDPRPISSSSLCTYASFDLPTELEIDMYRNYREYMQIAQTKPTQSERVSHLLRIASSTHEAHSKLVSGLVFAILTTSQSNHESLF